MTFYHGSIISGITKLGTNSLTHDEAKTQAVYLTPNYAYALFYIRDLEVDHVTCGVTADGYVRYDEQYPEQMMKIYQGINGYLYHCSEQKHFSLTKTRDVWVSAEPVAVESVEYIPDVYTELLKHEAKGDIKVIRYNDLTDERKQFYYDMALQYIFKRNFTDCSSKKAAFWRENFPQSWEYAIKHHDEKQEMLEAWEERKKNGK